MWQGTAFLITFTLLFLVLYGWWIRYRLNRLRRLVVADPILASARGDTPVIVYFSDPTRWLCQTRQQPTLERLRRDLNHQLHIIEIDVRAEPEIAARWGVVTTPITFVLDQTLQTCHVNDGVATFETLKAQVGVHIA